MDIDTVWVAKIMTMPVYKKQGVDGEKEWLTSQVAMLTPKQMERMLPLLTEEEAAIYRRGRNARVHAVPKNATPGEYSKATGLECLFGALYLAGETDRINELFSLTMEDHNAL